MNEEISKLIESLFKTQWDAITPTAPAMKYENVSFVQPTSGEWATMTIIPGSSTQISMGSQKVERQLGIVIFQIFTPKNSGTRRAKVIEDLIAGIFRYKMFSIAHDGTIATNVNGMVITVVNPDLIASSDVSSTILFRSPEPIAVGDRIDFYQQNLKVPFQADKLFS